MFSFTRSLTCTTPITSLICQLKMDEALVLRATTQWLYSTSSGPGGQAVNRRLSRAELRLLDGPATARLLPEGLVALLRTKCTARGRVINDCNSNHQVLLSVRSEVHRSLEQNKAQCVLAMHLQLRSAAESLLPQVLPTTEKKARVASLRALEKCRLKREKQMTQQRKASRRPTERSNRI